MADKYSTKAVSKHLMEEIMESIKNVKGWGSIEIYIQNFMVTQITEKNIKKPQKNK
ncbi:DUF2292 domain-containing protein [Candidatus Microgenomates bacterium]|nr:MAG: DUF2292 domain-containing protein [Candidatus Microgenomates bacterium]